MAESPWRIPVRFVAVVNLVYCVYLSSLLVQLAFKIIQHGSDAFTDEGEAREGSKGIRSYPWVVFGIFTAGVIVCIWFSFTLMTATKRGTEPQKAARLSKSWDQIYSVNVAVCILQIVYKLGATRQFDWFLATYAGITTVFILIVREYRKELDKSQSPISNKDVESA